MNFRIIFRRRLRRRLRKATRTCEEYEGRYAIALQPEELEELEDLLSTLRALELRVTEDR